MPINRHALPPILAALAILLMTSACTRRPEARSLRVTSTAYTTREAETKKGDVGLTAWGDHLRPHMKAIAVSRDLIDKGLRHNTKVKIDGLTGTYIVRDKMSKRWKRKIDIYMGTNVAKARVWGKKKVTIHWNNSDK